MAGKGVVRSIKNIAKGFSDVQIKVREATSNDPWGPSGTLMNEIAQLTYNETDFIEIMDMIDRRLNDKGKNWRHVFKALLLLDYCLHVGSENVVLYAKENIYVVKTLKEFQHIEENGKDVGANVRQKAKDITNLLTDDNRLREERRSRQGMRDRMASVGDYLNETVRYYNGLNGGTGEGQPWDDENELKKALAESKRVADEEERNRRQGDDDLEKAIQLSQQEAMEKEKKEREKLEKDNIDNLFGLSNNTFQSFSQQNLNPGMNNPYQQQQQQAPLQLEWSQPSMSNPFQAQQNPYGSTGLQAQMTGFVPQQQSTPDFFSQPQQGLQAQMTGFVPQQPMYQTSMATGTNPFSQMNTQQPLQPQQTKSHDYTNLVFGNQPAQPAQQQQQDAPSTGFASNAPDFFGDNSFSTTNATPALPAFASNAPNFFGTSNTTAPTANANNGFTSSPAFANTSPFGSPSKEQDVKYAKLNALLANKDDGMDTFGNQGNLRIPHGTGFANSFKPFNSVEQSPANGSPFMTSKNPFGSQVGTASPQPQKSLLDLMQEQKQQQQQQQQQQQFPMMTGFNNTNNSFF
ncbi:uncharacterized protein B0P05DRAFT_587631 [Gilbertella persicaria]|uniref:uncharacterized protein n=1 Tax=Gilbertella persicaria TaxID=101096 RepID=UPI00221E61C3|nr:uncharacterized protein B0P05DRAFT_587631 [Gilbertella persicaria]KAI8078015.1 hypothetical protein B0P05DRAFT_587631 [Gilbertella persicaria]